MPKGAVLGTDDPGPRRAVEYLLHAARRYLQMEAAFLAELTEHEQIYRATTGKDAEEFTFFEGGSLPRLEGYCHQVMESDAPWVIRDTAAEPAVRDMPVTDSAGLGAYIGVPVRLPDGRSFGTLCCVSRGPRPDLGRDDVAIMEALADILGFHVDQLEQRGETIGGLRDHARELADDLEERELQVEVFRHMVDASLDPMLLLDPRTLRIDYANRAAAEVAGLDRGALVGTLPLALHAGWDEAAIRRELAPLQEEEAPPVRYQLAHAAAAPAMDVQVQRVATRAGSALLLWTGHDVSTHREAEERLEAALAIEREASAQLRRLDQMRNAFLSAVSHELRTPLTTVRGVAETLKAGRVDPEVAAELIDRLCANAERLDRLLSDLLDLNQFAHGVLELQREMVRLDDLVREAVSEVDPGDHDLRLELEEVEAPVAPVKVERIVVNLVLNATIHTPPGTTIEVRLSRDDDDAHLVVADHGPGVPPADRQRVFEAFSQGAEVPAHRPGTGIGLSLVATLTELHGGKVWIEDAEGGGAAFHVLLPTTTSTGTVTSG